MQQASNSQYGAFGQSGSNFNASQSGQRPPANAQYDFQNVKAVPPPQAGPMASRQGRPVGTAIKGAGTEARPMTSNRGANFGQEKKQDPFYQTKTKIDLTKKIDGGPDEQYKIMEKDINKLIEDSSVAKIRGNLAEALEKAKEAFNKEKVLNSYLINKNLRRLREQQNTVDQINLDLAYCVALTYACQLQANGMLSDALQKYNEIIKSKQYPQAGRLRVNMGNIYFEQKKYQIAIKMYRMALDLIPATSKEMRFKIQRNIGHAFVRLAQFQDSIGAYEAIMKGAPDYSIGFNLMLCLYARGDQNKMKDCFVSMLSIEISGETEQEEENDAQHAKTFTDKLREDIKERRREAIHFVVMAAKLIAPSIEQDVIAGFEWILEQLKSSVFPEAENEIEICKAMAYLKKKNIEKSIETLKGFEKKDKVIMARIATNISFLFFLENDFKSAEKYAEVAIGYDRYNAKALVNRGNCLYVKNEFLRAKEQYLEAIGVEADCIEALYNLAFVNRKLNMFVEALQALDKLQTIVTIPEVLYQMASIYEMTGNSKQALKWYQVLLNKVPHDPNILARVGAIFAREEDEPQALHYFLESYRVLPTNIETISWLGIYYVKQELYERASQYFERASQVQPREVKWKLMVASCYRRMGQYQKALGIYQNIYQEYPENIECLRFLVQLCKDMGLAYEEYAGQLRKLEREKEMMADYNNPDLDMMNQQEEDPQERFNNQPDDNINIEKQTRRTQQKAVAKAAPKKLHDEDDNWAKEDMADDFLGI